MGKKIRLRLFAIVLVVITGVSAVRADLHVKQKQTIEAYYEWGAVNPAREQGLEYWLGKDRAAIVNARWTAIADFAAGTLTYLGHRTRVYVQTTLPLDPAALFDSKALDFIRQSLTTQGTVKPVEETKTILGRSCLGHVVETWVNYEGDRLNERVQTIWTSPEIPVDAALIAKVLHLQYVLSYFADDLIKGYEAIQGFPLLREMIFFNRGIEIKARVETLVLSEEQPGPAVYAVPAGYMKKAKIETADMQ